MAGSYLPSTRVARLILLLVVFILQCQPSEGQLFVVRQAVYDPNWWRDNSYDYRTDRGDDNDYATQSQEDYTDYTESQHSEDYPTKQVSPCLGASQGFELRPRAAFGCACPPGMEPCGDVCCKTYSPQPSSVEPWWGLGR